MASVNWEPYSWPPAETYAFIQSSLQFTHSIEIESMNLVLLAPRSSRPSWLRKE